MSLKRLRLGELLVLFVFACLCFFLSLLVFDCLCLHNKHLIGTFSKAKNIVFLCLFRNYSILDVLKSSYLSKVDIWNPNDILDYQLGK